MDAALQERIDQAQVAIVGSMLIDDKCIGDVLAAVRPDDFRPGPYKSAFQCIRKLFTEKRPADPVTVLDAMQGGEKFARFLRECMDLTPSAAGVLDYCRILRENMRLAKLQELALSLTAAPSLDDAQKLYEQMGAQLVGRNDVRVLSSSDLMLDFFDRMNRKEKPEYIGCGVEGLDAAMYIELGDVVGVGAAPSTGKTAFALQWADKLAGQYRVGFYSLETGASKIEDRWMARAAGVRLPDIKERKLGESEWVRLNEAATVFSNQNFEFVQASGMTASDVVYTALSRQHQVVFIDYLQLLAGDAKHSRERYDVVTDASMALHAAAQQHGILMVLLSQLSRPERIKGKYTPPDMHSFRESGQIEQDLDVAILLYLEDPDNYRSDRVLKVAKNKEGEKARVKLSFDGLFQKFAPVQSTYQDLKKISAAAKRSAPKKGEADDSGLAPPGQLDLTVLDGDDKTLPF